MENHTATIHDVAGHAGVSTATVSRALNEPWRVSHQTRERVLASVETLGYKPNVRARLLARGDTGTICFLLSNRPFIHSLHAQILQGAAAEADKIGVQIVYATCHYSPETSPAEIEMPRILAARGLIDGVIAAGTNYPNMLEALRELELPAVVFGTNLVSGSTDHLRAAVYVDDEDGGYQAAVHLISSGHRSIRFVGDVSLPWYRRRHAGYVRAMNESRLPVHEAVGSADDGELSMGFRATNELCDAGEEFTALFVGGDMGALGALKALANRGIAVPDQVSVVGFNDEEFSQIAEPPLTTVRVPTEEVGARSVEMLRMLIQTGEPPEPIVLPVKMVLRHSTSHARLKTHSS